MPHYQKHIFVCTNQKASGKVCCANLGGDAFVEYLKEKLKHYKLHGPQKIRVSSSGCLGRCRLGPCMVIYPEQIWLTYRSFKDIDEIIEKYLIQGKLVHRLLIDNNPTL